MGNSKVQACVKTQKDFAKAEKVRQENAEAKNTLESYVIDTRDKVHSLEGVETVSTEEEREALLAAFTTTEDWLYEDGMDLSAKEYKDKLMEVQAMGKPIFFRLSELEERPKSVEQAL